VAVDDGSRVLLLAGGRELGSWPLAARERVDLATVDELARLQLVARRAGYEIRVRGACRALVELLDLVGLGYLVLEVRGQAEVLEERGVEKVVEPDDPIA
jgi:hypothetical protein